MEDDGENNKVEVKKNDEGQTDLPEGGAEEEWLQNVEIQNKTTENDEATKKEEIFEGEDANEEAFSGETSFRMMLNNFEEELEYEEKETEGEEEYERKIEQEETEEEEEEEIEGEEDYQFQYPEYGGEGFYYPGEGEMRGEEEEEEEEEEDYDVKTREGSDTTTSEALSNVYSKLSPFSIDWSFGINANVELINLTTPDAFDVFCVSSHFGVIFNYRKNTMTFLPGHNYPIQSIAADESGRWLVTADAGEDTVIIIWDNKKRIPVWALYNVFPGEGVKCVKISQDARFLAAANCNFNYVVKFWMWTRGPVEADGTIHLDPAYGRVKHIDFNHKCTEQFAITTESKVIFCEWSMKQGKLDSFWSSFEPPKKKVGVFLESLFLDDNHTALTATNHGHVVVWCDVKYSEPISEQTPGTIKKTYLKTVKLHKSAITSLRLNDKVIMSSSEDGNVFFHDQFLRLVYWLPKLQLDPLVSVSFNVSRVPCSLDPFSADFSKGVEKTTESEEEIENVTEYESSSTESEEIREEEYNFEEHPSATFSLLLTSRVPRCPRQDPLDCTIDMRPIAIRDFMFLTRTGRIGYVSHKRGKVKYYLYNMESTVLCMDCHPNKDHLVRGDSRGQLTLYEYVQKKVLNFTKFKEPLTALKYSNMGHYLMAGFESGCIMELDPFLFTVTFRIEVCTFPILKICVSKQDLSIAFYDTKSTVYACSFQKKQEKKSWVLMGKYNSHYKPIKGVLFGDSGENPSVFRLFTIGEDRMLVEYEVKDNTDKKLNILSIGRIEQTAIPCCFEFMPIKDEKPVFLISNDEFKLKIIDPYTRVCQKTTLGSTADSPINFMKVILPNKGKDTRLIYATEKHIGIRILPPTGNPFEGMGIVAHPEKLMSIAVSRDYSYLFTTGIRDSPLLVWKTNLEAVEVSSQLGGVGLEPFVSLIEGGPDGFLFNEIEDFFYYAQIIHQGEDPNMERNVSKNLALCEVPDLFRSLGYYPTDYEVENILYELRHLDYRKTKQLTTEVTFDECVKAYLNHKPVRGMSLNHINKALLAIADLTDPSEVILEREELYKALEKNAEGMDHAEVIGYLCILLLPRDENNPIPLRLPLSKFAENVLGIDLTISEENVRQITHAFDAKDEAST